MPPDSSDSPNTDPPGQSVPEFPLGTGTANSVPDGDRDSVRTFEIDKPPVVSISDIHGHLDAARSALLTLRDHPAYDPVVVQDDSGHLHWADNDYVLLFNGDLIDRGPATVETLQMVQRLIDEAPLGRVRVTLGNHEMGVLTPAVFRWDRWNDWFSAHVGTAGHRALLGAILDGHVVAAYRGYNVMYAHAGHANEYDVSAVNESLVDAAIQLREVSGEIANSQTQRAVVDGNPLVLGMGENHPKGPDGGLVWIDFQHLPPDAPPQVIGHTQHASVTKKGNLICQNVILKNIDSPSGEGVLVETVDTITSLRRERDGSVSHRRLDQ